MKITTDRLILRPINEDDVDSIYNYHADRITNKYQGWIPKSHDDVRLFIEKISQEINVAGTWFQFVIIEQTSSKIIGDIGIHFIGKNNEQAELGCTLDKNYHNKGYAKEAMKILMKYLFEKLNKHRIITSLDPRNFASIKLVESLGFRKEAHFKRSMFINGEWVDDLIYAMLYDEWKKRRF